MKKKLTLISLASLLGLNLFFATPALAAVNCQADNLTPAETFECSVQSANPNSDEESAQTISKTLVTVLNVLSIIGGIAAVIVVSIQGLRLILSGGNTETVKGAREGIIYALVGVAIIIVAQTLVFVVLSNL